MDFAFTDEQEELRASARGFLADHSSSEAVRRAMALAAGHDPEVWKRIATELGWPALWVPEEHGGLGLGFVDLAALLEVMGEHLLCAPFFSSACLGVGALREAGSAAQQSEHLPGLAEGRTLATLAHAEAAGGWGVDDIATVARREAGGYRISGAKAFVLDGAGADLLIVSARAEGSRGEDGIDLFAVPGEAPGVERRAVATMDATRRMADVALRDVGVPAEARLAASGEGAGAAGLARILDRAAIALAAEQVGGAQRCLDLAVAYAKEREQFGRPIGSFQAIKHKCADAMVAVESARSGAYYAACVAAEGGEGGQELPQVAPLAKATASEAFFRCAADCLQIHGGVGFTWEYDVHLYFKRAKSTEVFLGTPAFHREQLARRLGIGDGHAAGGPR